MQGEETRVRERGGGEAYRGVGRGCNKMGRSCNLGRKKSIGFKSGRIEEGVGIREDEWFIGIPPLYPLLFV